MTKRRALADACGVAAALERAGDRWSLLAVRELLPGPARFTDLRAGIPDISPNVLGQRLRDLEAAGVIQRRTLAPPAASRVYELTSDGEQLEPVLVALARWGARSPALAPATDLARAGHLSAGALALHLLASFAADRATGVTAACELRLSRDEPSIMPADVLAVRISDQRITVRRGPSPDPVVVLTAPAAALGRLVRGELPLREVQLTGSRAAARRFLSLFGAPAAS